MAHLLARVVNKLAVAVPTRDVSVRRTALQKVQQLSLSTKRLAGPRLALGRSPAPRRWYVAEPQTSQREHAATGLSTSHSGSTGRAQLGAETQAEGKAEANAEGAEVVAEVGESTAMYTVRVVERERGVARDLLASDGAWEKLRVVQLLPGVPWVPPVELALPPTWTVMQIDDVPGLQLLLWAARPDLETLRPRPDLVRLALPPPLPAAQAAPTSVSAGAPSFAETGAADLSFRGPTGPVVSVRLSEHARQVSQTELDVVEELAARADGSGWVRLSERHTVELRRLTWGPHCPGAVLATHEVAAGCVRLALLIGLNAPQGECLELVLLPARSLAAPEGATTTFSPAELRLWEQLVQQTRPLAPAVAARLRGVLVRSGLVLFAPLYSDVMVLLRAEQRAADRAVQLTAVAADLTTAVEVGPVLVRSASAAPGDWLVAPGTAVCEVQLALRRPGAPPIAGSLLVPLGPPRAAFSVDSMLLQSSPHVVVRLLSADEQRRAREVAFRNSLAAPSGSAAGSSEPPRPPPADRVGRMLYTLSSRLQK